MSRLAPGAVYQVPDSGGGHYYAVVSRASVPEFVMLNFTTPKRLTEMTCVVTPAECPFLRHDSAVEYGRAKIVPTAAFLEAEAKAVVAYVGEVPAETLSRILDGAAASRFLPSNALALLSDQGLV